ncbi:hypothetical protein M758_4G067800 [Ceratodon purpureus]|nr:hypothetical protein M758_4G067800 [Ceratodon purpureus]KAG0618487.1 hypothetical protein M758_4G067800 [Ceratodon purpureus]
MAMSSEGRIEIDVRAKTRALNLRVRLRGALWSSPVGSAHRVSGSVRARFRTLILRVSLTLLQVLGTPTSSADGPTDRPQSRSSTKVRYSLRIRLRKLWLRIRGKHHVESTTPRRTQVSNHPPSTPIPQRKPKWRRTFSSVGNQLLLRNKSSEKITSVVSQEPVKENGFVAQYMDALGADRVVMAMHVVGMASTVIVLVQLAGARGLPLFVTVVTGLAIVGRIIFVNRYSYFGPRFQQLWHEAMSIGGISLVPQALGAIFRPYLPQSGFTASEGVMGTITLIMILLARYQRLPLKVMQFFGVLSAGIPAVLVLWAPIVQLWTCWWSPANVNFMQILTGLLAVVSNCFLGYSRS